jgi:hypothetical protein
MIDCVAVAPGRTVMCATASTPGASILTVTLRSAPNVTS